MTSAPALRPTDDGPPDSPRTRQQLDRAVVRYWLARTDRPAPSDPTRPVRATTHREDPR